MTAPRATYRLQLRASFGFRDATAIAPYIAGLGISHIYLSPIFKARPGSTHGYDITDHAKLNPELGSEEDYRAMIAAFHAEGLAVILDIVPNHMGVGGADNPLWLDVLEWGQDSFYAGWFDIDWSAGKESQSGKLLAPVLGGQYGEELRTGKLKLKFDDADGTFAVWAYDSHKLPLDPQTYPTALGHEYAALDRMADLFLDLPNWRPQMGERALGLKSELATIAREQPEVRAVLERRIAAINDDWHELDRLIAAQHWRAAFFRVAEDEINYRRFFNINDLAGLRMELAPVFERAHARVFGMLEAGEIAGLRIDHIDGLFDPKAYLKALRGLGGEDFYLVVEKILAPHEKLPGEWPVQGTTGYDVLNLILGLMVDASNEPAFTETYRCFLGEAQNFDEVVRTSKLRIMDNEMASELNALGRAAARLARLSPMTADLTRTLLQRAIKQVVANFPVYRTYLDFDGKPSDADRRDVAWALTRARRFDPDVHPSAFDFIEHVLLADTEKAYGTEIGRTQAIRLAMRVQQYSGPVMAKGVEDTAFYRYNRFLALNEVGGAPDRFGLAPSLFHKANAARVERWPHAMIATATHDTKRGEDARARLAVLSELPDEWDRQVSAWSRLLRARRGDVEGEAAPDRNDEYMIFQMLAGSWPVELLHEPTDEGLKSFRERIHGALEKSLREAKRNSNWAAPNGPYENAAHRFADEALTPGSAFLASFLPFVQRMAQLGVENSLVQTVLKLTMPGVPDVYQGTDLWDFTLVDPDNRRPVDYEGRKAMLCEMGPELDDGAQRMALFEALMTDWPSGAIKLATIAALLALRRSEPDLFALGDYQPIEIAGEEADCATGFVRKHEGKNLAVIVARFPARRQANPNWRGKANFPEGEWIDVFRGRPFAAAAPLRQWLRPLPFSVMTG